MVLLRKRKDARPNGKFFACAIYPFQIVEASKGFGNVALLHLLYYFGAILQLSFIQAHSPVSTKQ